MRTLCMMLCMLAVVLMATSSAAALQIQVAPSMLVLSSSGGKLTVHTNVPYAGPDGVTLTVDGTDVGARTYADDRGNLVAQCSKATAVAAVEDKDFKGKTSSATVTLTAYGDSDSETIRVKK